MRCSIKVKEEYRVVSGAVYNVLDIDRHGQKEFMKDLKPVYQADTLEQVGLRMDELEAQWGKKYPVVIDSWRRNWKKLTTYFRYDKAHRRLIYLPHRNIKKK